MSGTSEPIDTEPINTEPTDTPRSDAGETRPPAAAAPPDPPADSFPRRGRLIGIDYGTKRLGLAVSNSDQTIAAPAENYDRKDRIQDARTIARWARDYSAVGVIVGLPVHMSGAESAKSRESRAFGDWVAEITHLPVRFWDERFTSAMAEELLVAAEFTKKRRQARLDMLAAQILLQNYLDSPDKTRDPGSIR